MKKYITFLATFVLAIAYSVLENHRDLTFVLMLTFVFISFLWLIIHFVGFKKVSIGFLRTVLPYIILFLLIVILHPVNAQIALFFIYVAFLLTFKIKKWQSSKFITYFNEDNKLKAEIMFFIIFISNLLMLFSPTYNFISNDRFLNEKKYDVAYVIPEQTHSVAERREYHSKNGGGYDNVLVGTFEFYLDGELYAVRCDLPDDNQLSILKINKDNPYKFQLISVPLEKIKDNYIEVPEKWFDENPYTLLTGEEYKKRENNAYNISFAWILSIALIVFWIRRFICMKKLEEKINARA